MKSDVLIKQVKKNGWYLVRISGSHHHFKHDIYHELLTIPHPKKDLPKGTVNNIKKVGRI